MKEIEKRNATANLTAEERAPKDPRTKTATSAEKRYILMGRDKRWINNKKGGIINKIFPTASG
jgi:hypothetical protein